MANFANPDNKRAQRALSREVTPPLREVVPNIAGWGSGVAYLVAMWSLAAVMPYWFLTLPIWLIGFVTCWVVGMLVMMGTDTALEKRDKRQTARYRQLGHIVDISARTMRVWDEVAAAVGIPRDHAQAQPTAHYDLLLRIRSFDEAIADANDADRERLLARIREEITDELAGTTTQLQIIAE